MYTRRPSGWSMLFPTSSRSAWPSFWAIRSGIPMARPSPRPTARCRRRIRDPAVLTYLRGLGLVPGRALRVREVRALDGVVTAEDVDGVSHALGAPLARSILVRHRA